MNYYYGSYQGSVVDSLQALWYQVLGFLPNIVAALIFLILGWLVATFLAQIVEKVLVAIKIDQLANRLGMNHLSDRVGKKLSISTLGHWLVKWFFLIATFIAAADTLGLTQVSAFLYGKVFPYFGNVIVAVAILLIGIVAANFLSGLVHGAMSAGQLHSAGALASVTRWAIIIFAVLAALAQLDVATAFVQDLFRAVVVMFAIAGGLAFGLGGKDHAKKVLDAIERDLSK